MLPYEFINIVQRLHLTSAGEIFTFVLGLIQALCATSIIMAVIIDFFEFDKSKEDVQTKKSLVTTFTMSLYFVGFALLIYFNLGRISVQISQVAIMTIQSVGALILIIGAVVNVLGRLKLGRQWGDQVIIHKEHQLVSSGIYLLVRHPLYASLIWLSFGVALIYFNVAAFLLNLLVFIPFMYYRGKQEEKLLTEFFPEYLSYQKNVGMFLPNMKSIVTWFAKSQLQEIDRNSLIFCKWSMAIVIWIAVVMQSPYLLFIPLVNFLLSVIFTVRYSLVVLIYNYTFGLIIPKRIIVADMQDYRFVHLIAFVFTIISIVPLFFGNTIWLWIPAILFAILKTITALGYCPASKLRNCLLNNKGKCCKFGSLGGSSCNA